MSLLISRNLLNHVTDQNISPKNFVAQKFKSGNLVRVTYKIVEGSKPKSQSYEGVLIALNNVGLSKSITLRRTVQGVGIEQVFPLNSPNLLECKQRKSLTLSRRSKLYFLRKTS